MPIPNCLNRGVHPIALRFRKGQKGRQIAGRLLDFRFETLLVTDPFNSVPIACRRFYIFRLGILSLHDDSKDMPVFHQMVGDPFPIPPEFFMQLIDVSGSNHRFCLSDLKNAL